VLHQAIAEHPEVFLRTVAAAGDGAGVPPVRQWVLTVPYNARGR
jgi:hypothetical protein